MTMGDLERGPEATHSPKNNIVTWDGPDDPKNPKNWSFRRRWVATGLVSLITFMTPITSSMIAPSSEQIGRDLGITSTFQLQLVFSIFLLAFVFGPLFIAPLSEVYGRVITLQLSNVFFLIFNLACGFSQNKSEMLAFRFLSGLGGCTPQTVGGGVLSDLWKTEERGMAVSLYTLAPLLGPSLGPLMGAWITERTTWRWDFWVITIFGVCVQVLIYFTLSETYGPRILYWKAEKLRKETGNQNLKTEFELADRSLKKVLGTALWRPIRLLFTQPIIVFLATYMAMIYGMIYLMLSTFPSVWTDIYGESIGIGGLNYLSLTVGMTAGAQTGGLGLDSIYRRLSKKAPGGKGRPEFRVPLLFASNGCLTAGLLIYGWSAQFRVHWIVPNIGACIFAYGTVLSFTSIQLYTIDAYTVYAASAIGTTAVTRALAGFGFPLFAPAMFDKLGFGWGNTLLALVCLGVGMSGATVLWVFGEKLREMSPFAAGSGNEQQNADGPRDGSKASEKESRAQPGTDPEKSPVEEFDKHDKETV